MNPNGERSIPDAVVCGRCAATAAPEDNFCRNCGRALRDQHLPSVREERLPAAWQPSLSAVVARGAAVVAVGTLAELVARRLLRAAVSRAPKAPRLPARHTKPHLVPRDEPDSGEQVVSETLLLRRIRIRR